MSAAGPAANLLLATIAFVVLKILLAAGVFVPPEVLNFSRVVEPPPGTSPQSLAHAAAFLASIILNLNVLLFLFNLIPLPPLDGSGIVQGLLPDSAGPFLRNLSRNPMMSLIGLFAAWRLFDLIYPPAFAILLTLLHPGVSYH